MTTNAIPKQSLETFLSYDGRYALFEAYWDIYERFMPLSPDEVEGERFVQSIGISIASKVGVSETVENGAAIAKAFIFYYAEMTAIYKFRAARALAAELEQNLLQNCFVTYRPNRFPNS